MRTPLGSKSRSSDAPASGRPSRRQPLLPWAGCFPHGEEAGAAPGRTCGAGRSRGRCSWPVSAVVRGHRREQDRRARDRRRSRGSACAFRPRGARPRLMAGRLAGLLRAGARVRTVRVRVVLPGGSGGSGGWAVLGSGGGVTGRVLRTGWLCLRGGCLRCRTSGAGGGGRTGRCWSRRAGRRGAGAVLRLACCPAAGRRTGSAGRGSCRGRRGGRGPARRARAAARPRSRPRRRRRPRSARWMACLSSSSLGAVRPASGWTAAVSMRRKTALLASAAASSRSRRLLVIPGCIHAGISSHRMRVAARSSPLRSVISPSGEAPYQRSPELS